ncbi:TetR/AcrR family transcriptional regulator [Lacticaseibacillus mingshuiensis]|uniref:TetR/AcrR family transcriptional regulator n=1 Tax=Lacticaseibacillus mingshuiensis TaxID=2799574 RepID=A0ABW4CMV9_9LACO|nr:TetR/AcrR family transcriptional regulator [Lacticaseibacillus mingshuiensis]
MVSKTFENLGDDKKARVTAALLKEFSTYPLATAQVARIVADAGIARGAFYKYFDDLPDAYRYLFGQAMREIHQGLRRPAASPDAFSSYLTMTRAFLTGLSTSAYGPLIAMHDRHNEAVLGDGVDAQPSGDTAQWAAKVLTHETLRCCVLDPASLDARLDQLAEALTILTKR